MQVTFRYTKREFLDSHRLNSRGDIVKWKTLGLVVLTLIPSAILSLWVEPSIVGVLTFGLVAAAITSVMIWAIFRRPKLVEKFEHSLTFSPETFRHEFSHSVYEIRWERFDEFIETKEDFRLRRLERFILFPKRIFSTEQCSELRILAQAVEKDLTSDGTPSDLFRQHLSNREQECNLESTSTSTISQANENTIYSFTYEAQDLINAFGESLQSIDESKPDSDMPKSTFGRFFLRCVFLSIGCGLLLLATELGPRNSFNGLNTFFMLTLVVGLPFVLLIGVMRLIRARSLKQLPQLPREKSHLALTKTGFSFGAANNVCFTDWRDVSSFLKNKSCFGFKIPIELIQIVPKRIFESDIEAQRFIEHAMRLNREYRRSFVETKIAIESGNPFQAPGAN